MTQAVHTEENTLQADSKHLWIIESNKPNLIVINPVISPRFRELKKLEREQRLSEINKNWKRAEQGLTKEDEKKMQIVGPDADKKYSYKDSRGTIYTTSGEVAWLAYRALQAQLATIEIHPHSRSIAEAERIFKEAEEKRTAEDAAEVSAKIKSAAKS